MAAHGNRLPGLRGASAPVKECPEVFHREHGGHREDALCLLRVSLVILYSSVQKNIFEQNAT